MVHPRHLEQNGEVQDSVPVMIMIDDDDDDDARPRIKRFFSQADRHDSAASRACRTFTACGVVRLQIVGRLPMPSNMRYVPKHDRAKKHKHMCTLPKGSPTAGSC